MKRIVVGLTGASGVRLGLRFLELLRDKAEIHLVVSPAAWQVVADETNANADTVKALAHFYHDIDDFHAPIASGSFHTDGMVVLPCSIKTLSSIAHCSTNNLLVRAADVTLKQRRRLILGVRETPFHAGHLALMVQAQASGAIIAPPIPAFYHKPETIDDLIDHYAFTLMDLLGIDDARFRRWGGEAID